MLSKTDFQANTNSHNDDAHSITGVLKFQTNSNFRTGNKAITITSIRLSSMSIG